MVAVVMKSGHRRVPLLRNKRVRALVFQGVIVVGLLGFFGWLINNTIVNLQSMNIASGFDFLGQRSGFGVSQSLISYNEDSTYAAALWVGFLNTLLVACCGIVISSVIGFIVGVGRLSHNWLIRILSTVYVEVFRNIPPLLVIFFWYFGILSLLPLPKDSLDFGVFGFLNNRGLYFPQPVMGESFLYTVIGTGIGLALASFVWRWAIKRQVNTGQEFPKVLSAIGLIVVSFVLGFCFDGLPLSFEYPILSSFNLYGGIHVLPEFIALCLALSFYTAAFIAEIVRGGILGVKIGQSEAAESLGLGRSRILRFIIIPQALRFMIPTMTSQYLNLTKNSSLAIAIGYPDLVSVGGTILNQSGRIIEVIFIWIIAYLVLSLGASAFMNWFNNRMKLVGS